MKGSWDYTEELHVELSEEMFIRGLLSDGTEEEDLFRVTPIEFEHEIELPLPRFT